MTKTKGVVVSGFIKPTSELDTYATHIDSYGKGGYRCVANIGERNAISLERRSLGMFVYVLSESKIYVLTGELDNTGWQPFLFDGTPTLELENKYILQGGKDGLVKHSAILQHMRLDFLEFKSKLSNKVDSLPYRAMEIGDINNRKSQIKLGVATFGLPTLDGIPFLESLSDFLKTIKPNIPIPNPAYGLTSPLDFLMSSPWLSQTFGGDAGLLGTGSGVVPSTSLAMAQIKAAKTFKILDNTSFIVSSRHTKFIWDNPLYAPTSLNTLASQLLGVPVNLISQDILDKISAFLKLYGLGTDFTFTQAQSLGELETGLVKNTVENGEGQLSKATAGVDYVDYQMNAFGNMAMTKFGASEAGEKFIFSSGFRSRRNVTGEFGRIRTIINGIEELDFLEVLEGDAINALEVSIESLLDSSFDSNSSDTRLLAYDYTGRLAPAIDKTSLIPVFLTVKNVLAAIATITALNIAYELYTTANTVKVTAIEAKDLVQDGLITTAQTTATAAETTALATEAQVVVLVEALETLTGVTVGSTLVNFALNILGLVQGIATSANLNTLDADTIHKASDYTKTQNIFIDQITAGVRGQWASGFGIFGRDTSLLLANDIHPVYIKLGGYKNGVVAINDVTDCYAIRVNFYNGVTVADDKYWRPKSFTFCHHSMVGDQQITDIDLLTFDRDSSKFTFHKQVEASVSPTSLVIPTILKANLPSPIPAGFFCYCPDF